MSDRELLMRVLMLPHGNGSDPELDKLCADVLRHTEQDVEVGVAPIPADDRTRKRLLARMAGNIAAARIGEVGNAERARQAVDIAEKILALIGI